MGVGLEGDLDALGKLQGQVEAEMEGLGFPREGRDFQAHFTLGRVRQGAPASPPDPAVLGGSHDASGLRQTVALVSLMRSDLKPTGAEYTRLAGLSLAHNS